MGDPVYSYEIEQIIKGRKIISSDEYKEISNLRKNPQIDHIIYDSFSNTHKVWTTDGYYWEFQVAPT